MEQQQGEILYLDTNGIILKMQAFLFVYSLNGVEYIVVDSNFNPIANFNMYDQGPTWIMYFMGIQFLMMV